jgi:hypothetical protein
MKTVSAIMTVRSSKTRALATGLASLLAAIAVAPRAHAEPAPAKRPYREWVLLDPYTSERESGPGLGYVELEEVSSGLVSRGVSLELGGTITTTRGQLFSELRQAFFLRALSNSRYVFGASEYSLHAGLSLGPVELGTGFGVLPIGLELADGEFGLQMLCPQGSLLLAVDLGGVELGLRAHQGYVFHVWGGAAAFVRGLTLDLSLQREPLAHR